MELENSVLGVEEQQLFKMMKDADGVIRQFERELTELAPDNGPALELHPPGMPERPTLGANAKRRSELKEAIEKTKNHVLEKADKLLKPLPLHVKDNAREALNKWLQPDADRKNPSQMRDLDKSQDFALNLRYNKIKNPDLAKRKTLDQSQEFALKLRSNFPMPQKLSDSKTIDQSQDFALTLRNNGNVAKDSTKLDKMVSREPEAGTVLPKMSFTFFQDLKTNSLEMDRQEGIEKESESKQKGTDPEYDK